MEPERTYSPVEICEMFGISKSTLLRWEREGIISSVKRDPNSDQRQYTQQNVRKISQQLARQLIRQFSRTVETDNLEETRRAYEALYMWKFFQGEPTSLDALENYPGLSAESIRKLCRIGLESYEPSSPTFHRIACVIAKQSEKLSRDTEK
ncbi:MAG TPA: MerR family DNA-binding transcriptional regulator [Pyrinomonadaceae bacterium]|nr:MerR family DNA-binding transcriptional regulator [Pyrinomonadaceae bacterium]